MPPPLSQHANDLGDQLKIISWVKLGGFPFSCRFTKFSERLDGWWRECCIVTALFLALHCIDYRMGLAIFIWLCLWVWRILIFMFLKDPPDFSDFPDRYKILWCLYFHSTLVGVRFLGLVDEGPLFVSARFECLFSRDTFSSPASSYLRSGEAFWRRGKM